MPTGITTVVGRAPIPFAGYGDFGVARQWSRSTRPTRSRRPTFAGSSDVVEIAREALRRYQAAIDVADEACSARNSDWWTGFSTIRWLAGDTSTASICSGAAQMHVAFDDYSARIADPNTTDEQIAEIIGFINEEVDIHDLVDLAKSTSAGHVLKKAITDLPKDIAGAIPLWAYLGGAAVLAVALGWKPFKKGP